MPNKFNVETFEPTRRFSTHFTNNEKTYTAAVTVVKTNIKPKFSLEIDESFNTGKCS